MKKTYAVIAVAALIVVSLAATAAILQNQPSQSGSGQLSIMGTDPPVTANGVSDSKIHYNSVQAHKSGADQSSGWTTVSGSGTLDLMSSGSAQTIATSKVGAGAYDAFRFNVDSCQVVYNGQTYTAAVASTTVTAMSQSKVFVNDSSSTAAVVDMRTFVANTGNSTKPQFVFSATAQATAVPPSAIASISLQVGSTAVLSGTWWTSFVAQTSTQVNMVATLSTTSLVVNVQNSGSANAQIQEVIVTPVSASAYASASLPASFAGSAVFNADGTSTLQSTTSIQSSAFLTGGATLSSGATSTLKFNGAIAMNFGSGSVQVTAVIPGQQYIVTVIGANTYASALVVAS